MPPIPFLCRQCARALLRDLPNPQRNRVTRFARLYSQRAPDTNTRHPDVSPKTQDAAEDDASPTTNKSAPPDPDPEPGPMTRRLEEATGEALLAGGRAGLRAVRDAGFSEDLKNRLLERLASARADASLAAEAVEEGEEGVVGGIPAAAGQGTRDVASARPWTGEEAVPDAVLRMLDDTRRPLRPGLRGKPRIPVPRGAEHVVDMRVRRGPVVGAGERAAAARDRAAAYAGMGMKEADVGLSEAEREAVRREFRERFSPGARGMPSTVSGLAALANERIEDAIARGQFKDIPRGKGVERDDRASNPFVDTTEYIMNNMIKRQEIVPPWIEKQQELSKAAHVFRARLRNDWKRHAARMIASRGGSLQEQISRAVAFARAEEAQNPRQRNVDQMSVPTNSTDDAVMANLRRQAWPGDSNRPAAEVAPGEDETQATLPSPFRDPSWEATERSYMELAISNLNSLARSYNLMAPELAKKPYFSLARELNNCFADVAPLLANEIKERAARPSKSMVDSGGAAPRGILDRFGKEGSPARIYESKAPQYGFKEMWRDLWSRPGR